MRWQWQETFVARWHDEYQKNKMPIAGPTNKPPTDPPLHVAVEQQALWTP